MRSLVAVLSLVCIMAFACTAATALTAPSITATRAPLGTVSGLRTLKFPYAAVKVMGPGSLPAGVVVPPGSNASAAYATGAGVTLTPCALRDVATGSFAQVHVVFLTPELLAKLQNKASDASLPISWWQPAGGLNDQALFDAIFASLPAGQHTYILNLRMWGPMSWERLELTVGNQKVTGDKLVINGATRDMSLLFTYDGTNCGNAIAIWARWQGPAGQYTALILMNLDLIQLVQFN